MARICLPLNEASTRVRALVSSVLTSSVLKSQLDSLSAAVPVVWNSAEETTSSLGCPTISLSISLSLSLSLYLYLSLSLYIYIYTHMYIYIYTYIRGAPPRNNNAVVRSRGAARAHIQVRMYYCCLLICITYYYYYMFHYIYICIYIERYIYRERERS